MILFPANASLAMVFSFFVAMTITPWLLMKIARSRLKEPMLTRAASMTSA